MANKSLFSTRKKVPVADVKNNAGGKAYSLSSKNSLAQYCVTNTFNGTYYSSGQKLLGEVQGMVSGCDDEFLIKAALYSRKVGKMKDMPAYILAELTSRKNQEGLERHFSEVINNTKMLRNFTQIIRSGVLGRKSFGSAPRNLIQRWLTSQDLDRLFYDSIGDNPSLGTIIKWTHPKPNNKKQEALFGWLIGKEVARKDIPILLKQFEDFKAGKITEVPAVDFRRLTTLSLTTEQWIEIGYTAGWNMIRMNLNTFARHGCFKDKDFTRFVIDKLSDESEVRKSLVFPYQLFTAYKNIGLDVPQGVSNALQQAMEVATKNVPDYEASVVVAVDTSGSMSSPVTGNRGTATTKMSCTDVAALIAASILRSNKETLVLPFDTNVHTVSLNPFDSVTTNAQKLARNGGGTDCSSALRHLNKINHKADLVIYVSDNESWYNAQQNWRYKGTNMVQEWQTFKGRNRLAKMVCINLTPNQTVQAPNDKDVLDVGGFHDQLFSVVKHFNDGKSGDFAQIIEDWYDKRQEYKNNQGSGIDNEEEEG